ncbi:hypothetical protein P7E02_24505 [Enterococcus hulanensis]|uniref:hypothetical protein n=1 Tax=Enterococcus hulanensis TaxID=2559929 RepID=UPI00288E3E68|nr:hypothetical protein [Enterococcus hulanensis]MDT2663045.1 hypothetical protein [Enterococcus hulanensis]
MILEDAKWIWSKEEIERAISLFSLGLTPSRVAEVMDQKAIDIGLIYLHLLQEGKIEGG